MRVFTVAICLLLFATIHCNILIEKPHYDLKDAVPLFEEYVIKYNKHYKSQQDRFLHFLYFVATLSEINRRNKEEPTAVFDLNQFADYTNEESKELHGLILRKTL